MNEKTAQNRLQMCSFRGLDYYFGGSIGKGKSKKSQKVLEEFANTSK